MNITLFSRLAPSCRIALAALALTACSSGGDSEAPPPSPPVAGLPNILFIVLDDVGVDQLAVFGYGGATPASTPNIDAIARAGVRFRNTWSMPTCSPTRAMFFDGRYPFRTQVLNAVLSLDLANSQVSPYEVTTPKILKEKGYINAVIGKLHLSGSDLNPANNPLGNGVMRELGWDYFEGYLDGAPYPIDTTAGGVSRTIDETGAGAYACGFVPNTRDDPAHGADSGACYMPTGSCTAMSTRSFTTPGRSCLEQGGIFDPGQSCRAQQPAYLDFDIQNGYYTGEWIINEPNGEVRKQPVSDPRSRGYRATLETDRAVAWLQQQSADTPWMLSLGYSTIHAPLQQPPVSLLPAESINTSGFTCTNTAQNRIISNHMLEATDHEIGRLLVQAGLAARHADGSLDYRPSQTNTMVIIVADNGTYAPTVKLPFDSSRAKGSAFQTGIWVPLIVAGPLVQSPGRDIEHMVNTADLFSLFGELAEVDVREQVPANRALDSQPLLAYLTNPAQDGIRSTNYTEMGINLTASEAELAPPCVIPASNVCVQVFPQQGVCQDQSGIWYGPGGAAGAEGLNSCCAVNEYLASQGSQPVKLLPESSKAIRNDDFKLVRLSRRSCVSGELEPNDEFYRINQATPVPLLDREDHNLLNGSGLTPEQQSNYQALAAELQALEDSHVDCPGDGNLDLVVDQQDIENWQTFSTLNGGRSSWYDFNHDGLTDEADLLIIRQNLGKHCGAPAA